MTKLDLALVKQLNLKLLDSVDLVEGKHNSYALNAAGALIGVSLSHSKLTELIIAEEAAALEHLYLAENEDLKKLQFAAPLMVLEHVYLNNCALSQLQIPAGFTALKQLYVQKNKLTALNFADDCPALELLDASDNHLPQLSTPFGFRQLRYLFLQKNKLTQLTFGKAPAQLKILDVHANQLEKLPENFPLLNALETLFLDGNPLSSIPSEVIGSGGKQNSASTVLSYLKSIEGRVTRFLWEAKMVLVGNPEVGKSSIRIKLQDPAAPLPSKADRTPGLVVEHYVLKDLSPAITKHDNPIDFQLNIWDFGGQGRYREIQQLFCNRKSLYLYVTAHDDSPQNEDYVGLDYWLSMVNAYGYDPSAKQLSPVIYVLNKMDEKDAGIDEVTHRRNFNNLVKFAKISCEEYTGFEELITDLRAVLPEVSKDIFTNAYSPQWFEVKERLERIPEHHLALHHYLNICSESGLDEQQARDWLTILDRIGTVIYFGDNPALSHWIVLNPIWVKDAICNVIDSPLVSAEGFLKPEFYDSIWQDYPDAQERENLIKLMEAYKLAYPIMQKGQPIHVVPSALFNKPKPSLEDFPHLEQAPDFRFQIRFDPFIPAGMVNKLMVALSKNVYQNLIWGNGCILHDPFTNTYATVHEDWKQRLIQLDLIGKTPQVFYETLLTALRNIAEELKATKFLQVLNLTEWKWHEGEYLDLAILKKLKAPIWEVLAVAKPTAKAIRELMGNGKMEKALEQLLDRVADDEKNKVIMLQSRLTSLVDKEHTKTIDQDKADIERNSIIATALAYCKD